MAESYDHLQGAGQHESAYEYTKHASEQPDTGEIDDALNVGRYISDQVERDNGTRNKGQGPTRANADQQLINQSNARHRIGGS